MQISLAQAVALRSVIARRISDLISERKSVSYVTVPKGETYEKPARTIEQVTSELNEARDHYRQLDVAMAAANLNHTFEWDGREITIMEAIELAKQLRGELGDFKRLAARKKQEYNSRQWGETVMVEFAMYEPSKYQELSLKLERRVNRLSSLIEEQNHLVKFDFVGAETYLGE